MPTTSLRKRTNRRTILAISLKIVASGEARALKLHGHVQTPVHGAGPVHLRQRSRRDGRLGDALEERLGGRVELASQQRERVFPARRG